MITRDLAAHTSKLATRWPALLLTGPRQSGKTTLCRMIFPDHAYVSLELPEMQEFARSDPRAFLREYGDRVILDEVQRVPDLFSYLQVEIDRRPEPGRFILSGSAHLSLLQSVSQSLAGRVGMVYLLPCSLRELERFGEPIDDVFIAILQGGYPAIFDRQIPPPEWLGSYITTYVERDARQILNIGDLVQFQTFLRLCAGRTGQLLNLSQLGADTGIGHSTARSWISVLETSFISFRLRPYSSNLGKREVRKPKLYFYDTGLACALLGIRSRDQLIHHPLRGALFENFALNEILKARLPLGLAADLFFYRDRRGLEIDLLIQEAARLIAIEVKSGATIARDFFAPLRRFSNQLEADPAITKVDKILIYGGDEAQRRSDLEVLPWASLKDRSWI